MATEGLILLSIITHWSDCEINEWSILMYRVASHSGRGKKVLTCDLQSRLNISLLYNWVAWLGLVFHPCLATQTWLAVILTFHYRWVPNHTYSKLLNIYLKWPQGMAKNSDYGEIGEIWEGKKPIACTLLNKLLYDTTLVSKIIINLHVVCMVVG